MEIWKRRGIVHHKHYTYRVFWSEEDEEHVGMCAEFSSLSYLDAEMTAALQGIVNLVEQVVSDMAANDEPISAIPRTFGSRTPKWAKKR